VPYQRENYDRLGRVDAARVAVNVPAGAGGAGWPRGSRLVHREAQVDPPHTCAEEETNNSTHTRNRLCGVVLVCV